MDIEKEKIKKLIDAEHEFFFTTYLMSEYHKEQFHWIVDTILAKYGKDKNYRIFIYTIVKELIMNGIKANVTEIYAKYYSNKVKSNDFNEKKEEFEKLKEMLSDIHPKHEELKNHVQEEGISVKIYLSFSNEGILFVVVNEASLTDQQNLRIREKLKDALGYDSVADYFLSGKVDNTEGEGLGIITILTMMRQFGIHHRYLVYHQTLDTAPIPDKPEKGTAVSFYVPFNPASAKIHISEGYFSNERRKYDKDFWINYIKESNDNK